MTDKSLVHVSSGSGHYHLLSGLALDDMMEEVKHIVLDAVAEKNCINHSIYVQFIDTDPIHWEIEIELEI